MSDYDPIGDYLGEFEKKFSSTSHMQGRILEEVEDHLRQRAEELGAEGWTTEDAQREAIARFGTAEQMVSKFQLHSPIPSEDVIMIRRTLFALVALVPIYAAMHAFFSLVNEPTEVFTYVKVILGGIVVVCSLLVLYWLWVPRRLGDSVRSAIFVGSLVLIEIGTANIVWTAHLGLVSGDWEFYGFVGGAMISLLGGLSAVLLAFPELLVTRQSSQPIS